MLLFISKEDRRELEEKGEKQELGGERKGKMGLGCNVTKHHS